MSAHQGAVTEVPAEDVVITHQVVRKPVSRARRLGVGVFLVLLGLLALWAFGIRTSGHQGRFAFGNAGSAGLAATTFPQVALGVLAGVVLVGLGGWHVVRGLPPKAEPWALGGGIALFMLAFLGWVSTRGGAMDLLGLLQTTIALAVPLVLGALAGVLCERSGVINVAIEGQMLLGAFAGAVGGTLMGNYLGLVFAAFGGALLAAMLAVFAIKYLVNQVVLGVVLNVFALGLTGFFYNAVLQPHTQTLNQPGILPQLNIPLLSQIPLLGPLLFQANIVVYLAYALIIVVDLGLHRTRWGLRTRSVGEHPKAADTVGIKVRGLRYRNVMIGGAIAGLGGAYLTIGSVGGFSANITSGQGFIALAALIFGRWTPRGAVAASLLFGFTLALQINLSSIQAVSNVIPSNFLAMLPYIATIVAVAGLVGRVHAPAADGEPYVSE